MVTSTMMETRITRKRRWQSLPDKKTARTSLNFDEAENTPPRKRRAIDVENSPSNSSSENESAEESFNIKSFYGGRQKKNFPHSPRRRKAAGKILSKLSDENSASAEENPTLTSENGSSPDSNRSMIVLRNRKSSTNTKEESSKIGLSVKPVIKNSVTPNNKKRGAPVVAEVPENKTPTSGKKFFKHKSPASTSKLVGSSIIVQKGFNLKFVPRRKSSSADLKEKKKPPQSKFPRKVSKTVIASKTGDDINITPVTNGENNTPDSATNICLAVSDVSANNPVSITNNPLPVLSNSVPVSSSHSEGGCSDSFVTGSDQLTEDNSNTASEVISDDGSITDLSSLSSGPTLRSRGTTLTEGKKYFSIFNSTQSSPRSSPEQVSKSIARKFGAKSSPRMSPRLRIRPDKDSKDQMILVRHHYGVVIDRSERKIGAEYLWATPSDHFGLVGDTFKMKCIFAGNPTPEVFWQKQNGQLPADVDISQGGQEITIPSLKESDAGKYECYGTNTQGPKSNRIISLRVESRPEWVQKPKNIETSEGASATFICEAKGYPNPKIEWFVNGVPIDESKDDTVVSKRFLKPNDMNVTIVDLKLSDVFVIQCNCSNNHGYVFADVYLNVLKEAPQFIKRPGDMVKVAESNSINLTCQTSGKPDPIITWFKDGQQITGGRYHTLTNGDLSIESVVLSDAGRFRCTAENEYGQVEASGSLTVRRKARIESKPGDLEVNAGSDAKFTCTGTTDFNEVLNLGIYWQKDGKNITTNDQRMTQNFQDNSLTISGTISRDSGFYTCVVTDGLSIAKADAILTVKDKPDPPVDVTLLKCQQEYAEITWTKGASNNAPVQYFIVEYNTSFAADKWNFGEKVSATQTKATLSLAPNVVYTFRVLSVNKIGQSEPSAHTAYVCTTNPTRPKKNPENVRTIGDLRNFLVVEWTPMPPIEQAGDKFEYILTVIRDGITIHTSNINNYTIIRREIPTNDIFIQYNITVKAKNEIGESNAPLVTYRGYSAEDIPQVTVSNFASESITDNSATFTWDWEMTYNNVIPNTPIRGFFQGFKIQFWRRGAKSETFREREVLKSELTPKYSRRRKRAVTTLMYTVDDLQPYTIMEAQIVVMNTYYVSPPSNVISLQTLAGVPGPVRSFSVPQIGSNFFMLSWHPPDATDRNGLIVGYDIGYQSISGLDLGKMQDRDPQINDPYTNMTVLNGLVAKQKYRVHIWARTEKGRGEDYFIEVTTTSAGDQLVPSFDVKNVNETFFNVTWNRVINSKTGTVVYVEFRKEGASEWMQTTDEVSNNWKGVANLESGTSYEVRLAVTNGVTRSTSEKQIISTTGIAAAYSLGANFGWFIGMMLSLLVIIAIGGLVIFCRKNVQERMDEKYRAKPEKSRMYAREGEPRGQSNDYYKERRKLERRDSFDDVHKSSGSVDKYRDDDGGFDDRRYDDDYDDKRYSDYPGDDRDRDDYDDRDYDDDGYDRDGRRYSYDRDDGYDRDGRRYSYDRDDDYDRDGRRDSYDRGDDYDRDGRRYDDYDRDGRRYDDYDRDYDNDDKYPSDIDDDKYPEDDHAYEPYQRSGYERSESKDKKRISDMDDEYKREPSKFDDDGYPVEVASGATAGTPATSTFV